MPAYKGFSPMGPGDVKPWGTGDLNHEKNVIDCLVMDCISQSLQLTGHKHRTLYDAQGYQTFTSTDSPHTISVGRNDGAHQVNIYGKTNDTVAFQLQCGGYNYMKLDSSGKNMYLGDRAGGLDMKLFVSLGYGNPCLHIKDHNQNTIVKHEDGLAKTSLGNTVFGGFGGYTSGGNPDNKCKLGIQDPIYNSYFVGFSLYGDTAIGYSEGILINYLKPDTALVSTNKTRLLIHIGEDQSNPSNWIGIGVGSNYDSGNPQIELSRDCLDFNVPTHINFTRTPFLIGMNWTQWNTKSDPGTPDTGTGRMWFDGTNLKFRIGGTTKTITWS